MTSPVFFTVSSGYRPDEGDGSLLVRQLDKKGMCMERVKSKKMFPLFECPVYDSELLLDIIKDYRLDEIPVEDLELSIRTSHWLKSASIQNVAEVIMMYPFELRKIHNLGTKSVYELQEKVLRFFIKKGICSHNK